MNFTVLPNLIALGVLVAVFWAISRKATTERLYLWLTGWALVLLHFVAQFFSAGNTSWDRAADVIAVDLLVLAAVAFLISIVAAEFSLRRQIVLALTIAVPAVAYSSATVWGVIYKPYYLVLIALGVLAAGICCRGQLLRNKLRTVVALALAAVAVWIMAGAVLRGNPELGTTFILAVLNLAIAFFYAMWYRRATTGVMTTVIGFSLWGLIFPIAVLLDKFAPWFHPDGEAWNIPKYIVAVGMILTLFEDQIQISKYHAYHDELTGLPNRRLLEDRLGQALAHARRGGAKVAVLQLDLNRFKEVNDTYGHRVGDLALQEVAARLATCVQPGDTVARSGGDEFTVVSRLADARAAQELVVAMKLALSGPVFVEGMEIQTGLSIGVALYPDDGSDADQLHAAADRAMYAVKRATRTGQPYEVLTQALRP